MGRDPTSSSSGPAWVVPRWRPGSRVRGEVEILERGHRCPTRRRPATPPRSSGTACTGARALVRRPGPGVQSGQLLRRRRQHEVLRGGADTLPRTGLRGGRARDGLSPAWPLAYAELEPWYTAAEALFQVRGALGEDPSEPPHSAAYPHPPVPDEPASCIVRASGAPPGPVALLAAAGCRSRPLAGPRPDALGCISRHPVRQARRGDRRARRRAARDPGIALRPARWPPA